MGCTTMSEEQLSYPDALRMFYEQVGAAYEQEKVQLTSQISSQAVTINSLEKRLENEIKNLNKIQDLQDTVSNQARLIKKFEDELIRIHKSTGDKLNA